MALKDIFNILKVETRKKNLKVLTTSKKNIEESLLITYTEQNNTIQRSDGKKIADKEISYLMQVGHNRELERIKESQNPKFHRTTYEEDLSFNFITKYAQSLGAFERTFTTLHQDACKTNNLSERVDKLNTAIETFNKAKSFCYSKGRGGTIYFQDMWEYLHNSKNSCFSYLSTMENLLNETLFARDVVIPNIINVISKNDGILQKDIYIQLYDIDKSNVQRVIRNLEKENRILRVKKGSSYALHLA